MHFWQKLNRPFFVLAPLADVTDAHFATNVNRIWAIGDVFLAIVIFPNLIALILLSGKVKELTVSYFERKPWISNEESHKRWKATHKK